MKKSDIKECPFCGGSAGLVKVSTGFNHEGTIENSYMVQCLNCRTSTRVFTSRIYQDKTGDVIIEANGAVEAVSQWNRRRGDEKEGEEKC